MSDPAIEAAWMAWSDRWPNVPQREDSVVLTVMTAAAREALAPLRSLHFPSTRIPSPDFGQCVTCHTPWPSPTDRLIYPSEELS